MMQSLLFGFLLLVPGVSMAIEEPKYSILKEDGPYSLRQYEPTVIAETLVDAGFEEAGNGAFRKLAGYIFGGNANRSKIAMTAPVGMEREGEGYRVHFTMPGGWAFERLPLPDESSVKLRQVAARKMAVIRYSGSWSRERYLEHEALLKSWMEKNFLVPKSNPVFARYNSPWTLWFLRRNEVLIQVD
jgi:hypothetical protein